MMDNTSNSIGDARSRVAVAKHVFIRLSDHWSQYHVIWSASQQLNSMQVVYDFHKEFRIIIPNRET